MAGLRVAGSWTSPRTGVPAPRYRAGFLVMPATSWPAWSKATHNRRPTKPDAPATSTFTGPPEPSVAAPAYRGQARPSRSRDTHRLPARPGSYTWPRHAGRQRRRRVPDRAGKLCRPLRRVYPARIGAAQDYAHGTPVPGAVDTAIAGQQGT